MNKVQEFKMFLESIAEQSPSVVAAITECTTAIFENEVEMYDDFDDAGESEIGEGMDQSEMTVSDDELKELMGSDDNDVTAERSMFKSIMKTDLTPEQIKDLLDEDGKIDFARFSREYEDQFLKYIDRRIYGKHAALN